MTDLDLRLPPLPHQWQIQVRLRCGSICGHPLPARVTNGLLRLRDVSLLQLYLFLAGEEVPALQPVVRTEYQRTRVVRAYKAFYAALLQSRRRGRVRSERVAWIIPDHYLTSSARVNHLRAQLTTTIRYQLGLATTLRNDIFDWLPWTSLAIVACLRRWRAPRVRAIRRATFKLTHDFAADAVAAGPWEPGFPRDAGTIPLQALYQYEDTKLIEDSIRCFNELGLTCVNDLRFLHPDAVAAAKDADQALLKLYRALRRDS